MKDLLERLRIVARERRKAIAALIGVPVAAAVQHLGLVKLLGVDLSGELEVTIVALVVGAIVERIPNKRLHRGGEVPRG
jgi:hypothetical protein